MNSTVIATVLQADGRYLTDDELQPFQSLRKTHATRLRTYGLLEEQAEALINQALDTMAQTEPNTISQHRSVCQRDMSYVLRAIAVAILQDDEAAFIEQLVLWMQNIMKAVQKEKQSAWAYRILQEVVSEKLPAMNARLVNHFLQVFIDSLVAGI